MHRLYSSMDPIEKQAGWASYNGSENSIGITPSEYLAANPYADVDEMKLMKRFVLERLEEIV